VLGLCKGGWNASPGCPRHGADHPCCGAMGNLYRFVEPVVLFLLGQKGCSYGYERASELRGYTLTDAEIEVAALDRALRQLEHNECVESEWEVGRGGPARWLSRLTPRGREHLDEWITVLDHMAESMRRLVIAARPREQDAEGLARAAAFGTAAQE
jgi:DNA-binding PadR family transcriptional regulator